MKKWTEEEITILKNQYRNISKHDLLVLLSNRTLNAIHTKASYLKLCYTAGTPEERFWQYVDKGRSYECWNWIGTCSPNGYGQISLRGRKIQTHRFSWVLKNGIIPDGLWVCHTCDNRKCVNPNHLFLGTRQDNSDDMKNKNRQAHKLTENQVKEIRQLCNEGKLLQKEIAKIFNVCHATINNIHRNKIWKHVK